MEENFTSREDRILNSLDGIQKARVPDFFYTRLTGRMQQEWQPERKIFFMLRPAFVMAALSLVLILNLVSLTGLSGAHRVDKQPPHEAGKPASIESFAKAYNLDENFSVYE